MTTPPSVPPGWYPDPSGQPGQRYYDGKQWTKHFQPTPPAPAPPMSVTVNNTIGTSPAPIAVAVSGGTNHALHLILTLLTCGLWLPVWILVAIFSSGSSVAIANGGVVRTGGSKNAGLIVLAVFGGLILLGAVGQYPWLFIPLLLMAGGGGFFFWKQKTAKEARELELRERELRDAAANRAEYEDQLFHEGDPRGVYGRYPPPPLPEEKLE
jgi:Protein of unknown function (DUF2510)